jgi:AcrR family transcriptional regulator
VSRAESPARIIDAAIRLGTARGASALSVQGVASAAGVSKALVLYHFASKAILLTATVSALAERSAARLREAARHRDPQEAWRALVVTECDTRELGLLAALSLEPEVSDAAIAAARAAREHEAAALATRVLASVGLAPRIPIDFIGRVLLRELDGIVVARARLTAATTAASDAAVGVAAEQDAMLLALMALGR